MMRYGIPLNAAHFGVVIFTAGLLLSQPVDNVGVLDGITEPSRGPVTPAGRYGEGHAQIPDSHLKAVRREALHIVRRDAAGKPSETGGIVTAFIGVPAAEDFQLFINAMASRKEYRHLSFIDCSQPGATMKTWSTEASGALPSIWSALSDRLGWNGHTVLSVQAAWIFLGGQNGASRYSDNERESISAMLAAIRRHLPNLRIAYLSSAAVNMMQPAPYCYRYGLAIRECIRDQIAQKANMNYDISRGPVRMPLLMWGPDASAAGASAASGNVLPAPQGATERRNGRADAIFDFFMNDPAASIWFTATSPEK